MSFPNEHFGPKWWKLRQGASENPTPTSYFYILVLEGLQFS